MEEDCESPPGSNSDLDSIDFNQPDMKRIFCTIKRRDGSSLMSRTSVYWDEHDNKTICFRFAFQPGEHNNCLLIEAVANDDGRIRSKDSVSVSCCDLTKEARDVREFINLKLIFNGEIILAVCINVKDLELVKDRYKINTKGSFSVVNMIVSEDIFLTHVIVEADAPMMRCVLYNSTSRKSYPKLSDDQLIKKKKANRRQIKRIKK